MVLYAATIFLSAFLLFLVQPVIAKQILPWFGGAASVWATCLVFFQTMLLFGYAYADWTTRSLKPRSQVILHVALLACSLALLPIIPDADWKPGLNDTTNPAIAILALLLATIGLQYLPPLDDEPARAGVVLAPVSSWRPVSAVRALERGIASCASVLSRADRAGVHPRASIGLVVGGLRGVRRALRSGRDRDAEARSGRFSRERGKRRARARRTRAERFPAASLGRAFGDRFVSAACRDESPYAERRFDPVPVGRAAFALSHHVHPVFRSSAVVRPACFSSPRRRAASGDGLVHRFARLVEGRAALRGRTLRELHGVPRRALPLPAGAEVSHDVLSHDRGGRRARRVAGRTRRAGSAQRLLRARDYARRVCGASRVARAPGAAMDHRRGRGRGPLDGRFHHTEHPRIPCRCACDGAQLLWRRAHA